MNILMIQEKDCFVTLSKEVEQITMLTQLHRTPPRKADQEESPLVRQWQHSPCSPASLPWQLVGSWWRQDSILGRRKVC